MKSREEKQQKTDKAWNELYARLEQDGLLPQADASVKQHFMQSVPLRWAACIALLLAGTVAAWFIKAKFPMREKISFCWLTRKENLRWLPLSRTDPLLI
jgi:hypothetical protein